MDSAGPMGGMQQSGGQDMVSRQQAFNQGYSGNPSDLASSLNSDSQRQNDLVPKQFQAHSVLQQYIPSANGMAQSDASRRLVGGGMLPSSNGSSASTYEADRPLQSNRLNG